VKFCPKCSLKIKGNLTQCPICKVELLSCAEDEEVISQGTDEEHQEQTMTEMDSILSTESDNHTSDLREPVQRKAADNSNHTNDYSDLERRMSKFESGLKHIENKLDIALSQSDIFKAAVVDLESRITKVDQLLGEIKKPLGSSSYENNQNIEEEISRLALYIDQLGKDLESVKNNLKDQQDKIKKLSEAYNISMKSYEETREKIKKLEVSLERPGPSFEERQAKSDLSTERIEISDEGIRFPEKMGEDFRTEFESSISPPRKEDFPKSGRERERKFPIIIITILAAVIISSWFGFHYFKSQKQKAQKEIIAEKIEIPPLSEKEDLDTLPRSSKMQPTEKAVTKEKNLKPKELIQKSSQREKSVSVSSVITEKQSSPSKESITKQATLRKASGYTINVGSFRDKKRAQSLTKKLIDKGYQVVMLPLNKNKWYKVRVGVFPTFKEARSFATILEKNEKLTTFITEINKP